MRKCKCMIYHQILTYLKGKRNTKPTYILRDLELRYTPLKEYLTNLKKHRNIQYREKTINITEKGLQTLQTLKNCFKETGLNKTKAYKHKTPSNYNQYKTQARNKYKKRISWGK